MTSVTLGAEHRQPEHLQHAGIAFIEVESNDLGIPVDTQGELHQITVADREPVEQLRKRADLNDIVGDHPLILAQNVIHPSQCFHGGGQP